MRLSVCGNWLLYQSMPVTRERRKVSVRLSHSVTSVNRQTAITATAEMAIIWIAHITWGDCLLCRALLIDADTFHARCWHASSMIWNATCFIAGTLQLAGISARQSQMQFLRISLAPVFLYRHGHCTGRLNIANVPWS